MPESVQRLADLTTALSDRVGALALSVAHLDRRASRNERHMVWVVLGLVLGLFLSVAVLFLRFGQEDTNDRLAEAIARESQTRQQVLCPLYGLIIGSYNPESRPPGEVRDQYIRMMAVIIDSYPKLNCAEQVAPGSTRVG